MVRLKNLKKNDVIAECDILPEDSIESGHITVDLKTGRLEESSLPSGYEWCKSHVNHAKANLLRLAKQESLPEEYLAMWY